MSTKDFTIHVLDLLQAIASYVVKNQHMLFHFANLCGYHLYNLLHELHISQIS